MEMKTKISVNRLTDNQLAKTETIKKCSQETHTLCAGCSKAEPNFFAPLQTPSRGGEDQNLISWKWSLPLPTNPVWWGSMHAISSYRGNRPTNTHTPTHKHTHKQTHRQDRLQYTAPQLSTQCKNVKRQK